MSLLVAAWTLTGCLARTDVPSRWPTDDFLLEVRSNDETADRLVPRQTMFVFADGIVVYAESSGIPATARRARLPVPMFDTVSVYQLQKPSLRGLCRALERAGLFAAVEPNDESLLTTRGRQVSIAWRSEETTGQLGGRSEGTGILTRVIRAIDGYTPPGVGFRVDANRNDGRVKRALDEAPAPERSPIDALTVFRQLSDRHPEVTNLWLYRFGLALGMGRIEDAREALTGLRAAASISPQSIEWLGTTDDALRSLDRLVDPR